MTDTKEYNNRHRTATDRIFAALSASTNDPYQLRAIATKASDRAHLLLLTNGLRPDRASDEFCEACSAAHRMFLEHYSQDFLVAIEGEGVRYAWNIHEADGAARKDRPSHWLGYIDDYHTTRPFALAEQISHYLRRLKNYPELRPQISAAMTAILPDGSESSKAIDARLTKLTVRIMHLLAEDRINELEHLLAEYRS